MAKRKLTKEEITDIFQVVKINNRYSKDVGYSICLNIRKNLSKQLEKITIYEDAIPKLKEKIKNLYHDSLVQPGEMVGVIAASSIGADTTQASLNSVHYKTRIVVNQNGNIVQDFIGKMLDQVFEKNGFHRLNYTGQVDQPEAYTNPFAEVLNIEDMEWKIQSVTSDGVSVWKKVTQIIRHPLYTGLIKVLLKSGREVIATTGLSFVTLKENQLVATNGSNLVVGDFLPVVYNHERPTFYQQHFYETKNATFDLDYTFGVEIGTYLYFDSFCDNESIIKEYCGIDSMKHLPHFAYNASDEFLQGIIQPVIDWLQKENKLYIRSEQLASETMFILSKSPICMRKVEGAYELSSKLDMQVQMFTDVVMDEIVYIEEMKTATYVYDLTVEDTKIFTTLTGIVMYDSFHSSGLGNKANITSGLVRQQELLNASKTVKTPSCQIYLDPAIVKVNDLFSVMEYCNKEFIYYELENLIKSYVIEKDPLILEKDRKYYEFFKRFYDDSFEECEWRVRVQLDLEKMYMIKKDLKWITSIIYTTLQKSETHISIIFFPNEIGILDIWVKDNMTDLEYIMKQVSKKKGALSKDKKLNFDNVNLEKYLNEENKILFFIKSIIIPSIKRIPVSGIFGIEECYYTEGKDGWFIDTKGSNLQELMYHPGVLVSKTISNNMWDIYECFGIEATHSFLLQEFRKIISSVNKRHLDILIDSMTASGKISAVSRYGIDRKQVGPLSKACFEQPVENFLISATKGEEDKLKGVTSNVCMGKLNKMGTGMCELVTDISLVVKMSALYEKEMEEMNKKENINKDSFELVEESEEEYLI